MINRVKIIHALLLFAFASHNALIGGPLTYGTTITITASNDQTKRGLVSPDQVTVNFAIPGAGNKWLLIDPANKNSTSPINFKAPVLLKNIVHSKFLKAADDGKLTATGKETQGDAVTWVFIDPTNSNNSSPITDGTKVALQSTMLDNYVAWSWYTRRFSSIRANIQFSYECTEKATATAQTLLVEKELTETIVKTKRDTQTVTRSQSGTSWVLEITK